MNKVPVLLLFLMASVCNADDTLQFVTSGGGNAGHPYGSMLLVSDNTRGDMMTETADANHALSMTYLANYPETLDKDNAVDDYMRRLFMTEWRAASNTPAYRNPIQRPQLMQEWRDKLSNLPKNATPTLRILVPKMISKSRYDLGTNEVPVSFQLPPEMTVSSGETRLRCITVDKELQVTSLPIGVNELDAFFASNQNNRVQGRTASVLFEVVISITGKPDVEGIARPACQLEGRVESVAAYEYRGEAPDYTPETALPGPKILDYFEEAEVQPTFANREEPDGSAQEAQDFNLLTHNGLIVLAAGGGSYGYYKDMISEDSLEAEQKYGEFLSIGLQPDYYTGFDAARCVTEMFLTPADYDAYFPRVGRADSWLGATEFEQRRIAQAFKDDALPKLTAQAVNLPQRYLLVGITVLPEYDFDKGGFHFRDLNPYARRKELYTACGAKKLYIMPVSDQLREFWNVDANKAEAVLNSIPVYSVVGNRNFRRAYVATEVELFDASTVQPKQQGAFVPQPPLSMRIVSSTLYGDENLTQAIWSPHIIQAKPPVLEGGLPAAIQRSASYDIEYRGPDQLQVLKTKGDFEEWEWLEVARQQLRRDTFYYSSMKPGSQRNVTAPPSHDTEYRPFFPEGYDKSVSNLGYDGLTDEQKQLFKEWAKMQARAL
jgi:hypothetical protein